MVETVPQKPAFTKHLETYWDALQTQFKRPLRLRSVKTFPYRNLAFKGGGVRGIAYIGVLEILEREGILPQIERVAGTSVGAITATMVSMRLDYNTTKSLLDSLEFSRIPQASTKESEKPDLMDQLKLRDLACYGRLFNGFGWYSSSYFYNWLQQTIAAHCDGNGMATFADFKAHGFRDLYIVAANLTKHRAETFSYETTPDVAVADAVRMSMSIPFFFEALYFDGKQFGQGDLYVDGGMYDNYPVHMFDDPKYAVKRRHFNNGINWETLGCYLFPEPKSDQAPTNPANFWQFVQLALGNMYDAHQVKPYETGKADRLRTIKIGDGGISPVDFDIEPHGERYNTLTHSGSEAADAFLKRPFPKPPKLALF